MAEYKYGYRLNDWDTKVVDEMLARLDELRKQTSLNSIYDILIVLRHELYMRQRDLWIELQDIGTGVVNPPQP